MPRKKRTRRRDTDDDGGTFPSKRRHAENKEPLVISDSENEEEEYKPTPREGRLRGKDGRTQATELTEEEMLDLAVRLSEKEAGNAALREQQEEEDIRLAIAQSLHANGMQTNSDKCESLPLVMTPVGGSQPSAGQSPTPAAESPVFPPRQKPLCLSLSKRKTGVSTEDQFPTATTVDQFPTATTVGVAQNRKLSDPLVHSPDPSETPPICTDTPISTLPASAEVSTSQRKALGTDSKRESQDSSAVSYSQPGSSPVFPNSSSHKPVLCIEKLSQALEQDCHSTGFVLCSQKDPPELTQSSPQLSPEPPASPTFSCTDGREGRKGAQKSPETVAAAAFLPSGDKEPSESPPHSKGHRLGSQDLSEWTPKLKLAPLAQRALFLEGEREDGNRDHGDSDQEQSKEQPCQTSGQSAPGVSEHTAGKAVPEALQTDQEFPNQMTLHWSDDEDDEEGREKKQECLSVARTHCPPRSHNAVCEQSSTSDSESLLRDGPGPVASPVFPRDVIRLKPRISGASRNPASPLSSLGPLSALSAGVGGARCVRRKFTFRDMHAAASVAPSEQGEPSCSSGRGPRAGPSLQCQATPLKGQEGEGAVLYYWGVPFCPRGQNPDDYTQVILTQLEVYEKSLKSAQRGLLRKAEWGEPVLPGPLKRPFCRRSRLKRYRPARPLKNEEVEEEDEEEEPEVVEDTGEAAEEDERGGSQKCSEAGRGDGGCRSQDSEALEGPSQTLLEEQKSTLLLVPEEPPEKFPFLRRHILRDRSPDDSETQLLEDQKDEEPEEEEEGMCPETQLCEERPLDVNMESPAESQPRPESEVMDVVEEGSSQSPAAAGEEATMEVEVTEPEAQLCSERVECPICMRGFPLSQIEMHAAYCDGATEASVPEETSSQVMVLRKSSRRSEVIDDDQPGSSTSANRATPREKCYLCQGSFSVREYEGHVEACIRQKSTHSNQGAKSLLTALDRSEQKDSEAGPSHSSFRKNERSRSSAHPDADESGDGGGVAFAVSDSPIRAFTSISEATDCLVDFKRQYSAKPSQRAGRKRKFHR